jgi:dihydropyrimidinase
VTAGSSGECDVGVLDGKVVQLGGSPRGRREIDASGALVLPGGVDMHVHLSLPSPRAPGTPTWIDDFSSGSRAAIAGGVTTVGNMTFPWEGQSLSEAIARDLAAAASDAAVDYVLHPVLTSPTAAAVAELPSLAAEGHTSLKLFMMMPEFESRIDEVISAIQLAGRSGMLTLLHCEDGALVRFAEPTGVRGAGCR